MSAIFNTSMSHKSFDKKNTTSSQAFDTLEVSESEAKEKILGSQKSHKKSSKKTSASSPTTSIISPQVSYQSHPDFVKSVYECYIEPYIKVMRTEFEDNEFNLTAKKSTLIEAPLFKLFKGISENSIAMKIGTIEQSFFKINELNVVNGIPCKSLETGLASTFIEQCITLLIKDTNSNNETIWSCDQGIQFAVDLSVLREQYPFSGVTPMDLLIYKAETINQRYPGIQKFTLSTTFKQYIAITLLLLGSQKSINRRVVKETGNYFSNELWLAYFIFKSDIATYFKNISTNLKNVKFFRDNMIAIVRIMKKTERMKHLNFLALKEIPKGHIIETELISIRKVEHILTTERDTKTQVVKVITLTKKDSDAVDVYLFGQKVKHPEDLPNLDKKMRLLKFEMTPGTNFIWVKKATSKVSKAIVRIFESKKYVPSVYTYSKQENEIILTEIFKQGGMSLNSRTRAGTIDAFEEFLNLNFFIPFQKSIDHMLKAVLEENLQFKEEDLELKGNVEKFQSTLQKSTDTFYKQLKKSLESGGIKPYEISLDESSERKLIDPKSKESKHLKPFYDAVQSIKRKLQIFQDTLRETLESSLGSPIDDHLSKVYHNKDLDIPSITSIKKQPKKEQELDDLAKLSIAHIEKTAKKSLRRKEYPYKWVDKSIRAAIYDNPKKPVDVGDKQRTEKKPEKVDLEPFQEAFKKTVKEKKSDIALLGYVERISESIAIAFNAHKDDAAVKEMLQGNFVTEKLDDVFKETDLNKRVVGVFKKLLREWKVKYTDQQLSLFSNFFKVDFKDLKKDRSKTKIA